MVINNFLNQQKNKVQCIFQYLYVAYESNLIIILPRLYFDIRKFKRHKNSIFLDKKDMSNNNFIVLGII